MLNSWVSKEKQTQLKNKLLRTGDYVSFIEEVPQDISNWLSNLSLLYGCPFHYLVPDERMLPLESLRFFYLDQNWVDHLLDGACSMGRNSQTDYSHDMEIIESIREKAISDNIKVRSNKVVSSKINLDPDNFDVSGNCTGFLLRSDLVKMHRGLEFQAFSDVEGKSNPLPALRLEQLSDGILLGLYSGVINRLEIREPAENLHFGADKNEITGQFEKNLRCIENTDEKIAGTLISGMKIEKIPMRSKSSRVVNISETAKLIQQKLVQANYKPSDFELTSAEFALEMIENPMKGDFKVTESNRS